MLNCGDVFLSGFHHSLMVKINGAVMGCGSATENTKRLEPAVESGRPK